MNNKFNKVSFEEMLRYDGLIACEHELLISDLNKQPTSFSRFMTKLGLAYSDIEIRRIFLTCNWYTVIREKGTVVDFSEYLKSKTIEDSDIMDLYDEFEDFIDEDLDNLIEEEINNIFDKIDKKVESLFKPKDYELPEGGLRGVLESLGLIEKEESVLDPEDLIDTRCVEPEELENIIELEIPECKGPTKEEVFKHLDRYISKGKKLYFENKSNILGDVISYADNKIKVRINGDDEALAKYNACEHKKVEFTFIHYNYNNSYDLLGIFIVNDNIVELELPKCDVDKDTLEEEVRKHIKLKDGIMYILHGNNTDILGNIISYENNKIKVKLVDEMIPVFETSNKKVELVIPSCLTSTGSVTVLQAIYINANDVETSETEYKNDELKELQNVIDILKGLYL